MKKQLLLSFLVISINITIAQNQANYWFFSKHCGIDFNSGLPVMVDGGQTYENSGNATISDIHGNLMFYTEFQCVFNKNHQIMLNGSNMIIPGHFGRSIVKLPNQENIFYIFTAVHPQYSTGFYYSIVNMSLDGGVGAVMQKDIPVESAMDAADRIVSVRKQGSESIWVITRKFIQDGFASFLVDNTGFNPNPVFSLMPDQNASIGEWGYIKISYDKKYLVSSYMNGKKIEVNKFNASSGQVEYLYTLVNPGGISFTLAGIEFSPDSKYLYVSYNKSLDTNVIYQFEVKYIIDEEQFNNSAILVGSGAGMGMQLARDGKIYCSASIEPNPYHYVSVIHQPWIRGEGCMYELNAIDMYPGEVEWSLPNILLDYLLRFEWTGEQCQGYPIQFKPNFIPTPDSIIWNFDELAPGSVTTELSPTYAFKYSGVHEVKVDVWYPSGRYEHTSREIEIFPSPQPDLGSDTLICNGSSITLNANCQADFFSWSTGQFGVSSITVSDSGTYWVKGKFSDSGCEGYDTVHIGFHQPTIIDEANLQITPTTCNGASGSITGLTALGSPLYAYQWLDLSGNPYGTTIDATGLPAGQYQLTIIDGNGCETISDVYTIEDAGDLQVTQVQTTRPHCFRNDGQIIISAFSPSGSLLEYSIDDGASYTIDSVFSGLLAGDYVIRIQDTNGCEGFYLDNPVKLEDIPGPQVTQVNVTDETDFLGNGAIEILASGSTPVIYYSIDSGATWQSNNGTFENVVCSMYYVVIKDENGCDTSFTVEVQNIILTYLHAVTGEEGICEGYTALIPVNVDNFNNVADFHLKLGFNADNLECEGFANVNVQLLDSLTGWVDQAAGDIHLAWNGELPLTFSQQAKVADLVFTTKNPGQGQLSWYTGETESYFTNSSGNPIPAEFQTGEVNIYEPPEIILDQSKTFCTGQFVSMMSIAVGNQPPLTFRWIYPTGDTTSNDPLFFSVTSSDAGLYTLLATDRVGCTDQKSIELIVSENPVAAFHGSDTLEMQAGDVLDARTGLSSYLWNTGDSAESITINAEGMYKVEMESPVGCLGSDSVYVKLVSEEIPDFEIYVPNAFSPNGDGINDIFQIIFPNSTFNLQPSTLSIFDRWGGMVYESSEIENGWDGKKNGNPCPGGVYVYKIVFSVDGVQGNQERVGTVALVR
jgi:gliding motility-associated-like protein